MDADHKNKVDVLLAQHDGRLTTLEKRIEQMETTHNTIHDLRVEIGKLQMQIKITWILLMMVVGGLISIAFSVWKAGGIP